MLDTHFVSCCLSFTHFALLFKVLIDKWGKDTFKDDAKINIRLHNCPDLLISLKNLKAAYIGNSKFQLQDQFLIYLAIGQRQSDVKIPYHLLI